MIFVAGVLCSCGSESAQEPKAVKVAAAPEVLAVTPKEAEIAKIEYPACEQIWKGSRLSKCGEKSFRKSLSECQTIATRDMEGVPALLDEYAGDSWQMRAGRGAILSVDDRIRSMKPDSPAPYFQGFAYALGNGTNSIQNITCTINGKMHLERAD